MSSHFKWIELCLSELQFESTLGGSGTSYEVNSILVIKGKSTETDDLAGEAQERKTCKKKV